MANRGRARQNDDWDMKEDDTYEPQYNTDDDTSSGVHLDHCKLYITNIPVGLSEAGLEAAFAKYGQITQAFICKNSVKNFGMVGYETPGEAKLAMMKLNRTEPLGLNVAIAHKRKTPRESRDGRESRETRETRESRDSTETRINGNKDTRASSSRETSLASKFNKKVEMTNGDIEADLMPETIGVDEDAEDDTQLDLQLEQLNLQHLRLQEAQLQCRQRMLLLRRGRTHAATPGGRCILPDGRIVVNNNNAERSLDADNLHAAAGDSTTPTLPARMSTQSRECLFCGAPANSFCARCQLAPYCSDKCQTKDWSARHKHVCHNLAGPKHAAPAPLRAPHARREDNQRVSAAGAPRKCGANMHRRSTPQQPRRQTRDEDNDEWEHKPEKPENKRNEPKPQKSPAKASPKHRAPIENPKHETSKQPEASKPVIPKAEVPKPVVPRVEAPKPVVPKVEGPKTAEALPKHKGPASVQDVTPRKELVPKTCIIDEVGVGGRVLLQVDAVDATVSSGLLCLCVSGHRAADYEALCAMQGRPGTGHRPVPGELFAYLDSADGAWYRALATCASRAALVDASREVSIESAQTAALTEYRDVPQFTHVLKKDGLEVGMAFNCTLESVSGAGYKVSLTRVEDSAPCGEGVLTRWTPHVQVPAAAPSTVSVPRPALTHNSLVVLVEAHSRHRVLVRPADEGTRARMDRVLQDTVLAARTASPLKEAVKGQEVSALFTDGLHYRALVKRTSVKQDKYLLEYIDFGNEHTAHLADLYPLSDDLTLAREPTVVSELRLHGDNTSFTDEAVKYLDKLKDDNVEMRLSLPSGLPAAPSGSPASLVLTQDNRELACVLDELCATEWRLVQQGGGDVVDLPPIMYSTLVFPELPPGACTLVVLDVGGLREGSVSACLQYDDSIDKLAEKMSAYCESDLGKEPYLPKLEELCIAKCPPYPQWFRGVVCSHSPGSQEARVLYFDYGNLETVPVTLLRKMLPEFARAAPPRALHLDIEDFPVPPSPAQLSRCLQHLQVDSEGRGVLRVTSTTRQDNGFYSVRAPELLAVMTEL